MRGSAIILGLIGLIAFGLVEQAHAITPVGLSAAALEAELVCTVQITGVSATHVRARTRRCIGPSQATVRFLREDRLGFGDDRRPWPYRIGQTLLVFLHHVGGDLALTGGSFNEGELFVEGDYVYSQWNRLQEAPRSHTVWGAEAHLSRARFAELWAGLEDLLPRRPRGRRAQERWVTQFRARLQ